MRKKQELDLTTIESICVFNSQHDAIVYDLARPALHNVYTGARLLRQSNVWRSYQLSGTPLLQSPEPGKTDSITLTGPGGAEQPTALVLLGHDRLKDGVRVRWRWKFASATIKVEDALRLRARMLVRELRLTGLPAKASLAAATAASTSARPALATLARVSLVAGLITSKVSPEAASACRPLTSSFQSVREVVS